jgi:hypothetical protein
MKGGTVSGFVYKCIRVKDIKKPLRTRCGKPLGENGILCDKCYADAKKGKIAILMCSDVTNVFKVPFKNQVYIFIDLSKKTIDKGQSKTELIEAEKLIKTRMFDELDKLPMGKLASFYLSLKLPSLAKLRVTYKTDEYKLRYFITQEIVGKLISDGRGHGPDTSE